MFLLLLIHPLSNFPGDQLFFLHTSLFTNHFLFSFVENIRDKLAESIHEMWAMGKIEAGWTFGERRDDTMGLHPCLTQFQNLPQVLLLSPNIDIYMYTSHQHHKLYQWL